RSHGITVAWRPPASARVIRSSPAGESTDRCRCGRVPPGGPTIPRMVGIRAISADELDAWLGLGQEDPDNERHGRRLRAAWADGSGGPELTVIAEGGGGKAIGR